MHMKFHSVLFILILSLLIPVSVFSQQKKISIVSKVENLPIGSEVFICGNTKELGQWNTMIKMNRVSENEWKYNLDAEVGDSLQFKFTRGDWNSEAVDSNKLEFPNFSYVVSNDTTLTYAIPNWRDQVIQKIIISPERLKNKSGFLELFEGWQYKIGDDTTWKDPGLIDTDWKIINPALNKEDIEGLNWNGNLWFRNHIYVDSTLWNQPFGFQFVCTGAAEIFLDGKLLYKFGTVGNSKETEKVYTERSPRHILFGRGNEHLLAVRYSNHHSKKLMNYGAMSGFYAMIGELDQLITNRVMNVRELTINQFGFGAFVLAFAVMHLLLFLFYPKAKENLFYSVSMISFAAIIFTGLQNSFIDSVLSAIVISTINSISVQMAILFGLLTVYASSYQKMPKPAYIFAILSSLFILQTIFFPESGAGTAEYIYYAYSIILTLELFRVVIRSIFHNDRKGWGWLTGIGFLLAIVFIAYQILIITKVITQPIFGLNIVYVYGIVIFAITVSINLSKIISDTNSNLQKQLIQVKELSEKTIEQERKAKEEEVSRRLLEADNERKTKELEEARKLQLSMLPKKIPEIPNLEIAVYMKPATEVGGDYYDFKYDKNNSLLIAIGDATGHGMQAGTMVATIKGLFSADSINTDISEFLNKSNMIIREMHLGNLFMAMLLARIEGNKVTFSSAGMPPALIYRAQKQIVEEIRMQALPLGNPSGFEYFKKSAELDMGDTLLLMSDGFPELFNHQKEILDYDKAADIFKSVADKSPDEIIRSLLKAADEWKSGVKQEDDITFIVVKMAS